MESSGGIQKHQENTHLDSRVDHLWYLPTGDQPLSSHTGQMPDDFGGIFRAGRLYHRQVKTVVGKTCQGLTVFDELDQKG